MVPITSLRNFVLGEPLIDWLDRFGKEAGFVKDTELPSYVPEADLGRFTREKGKAFESCVLAKIQEQVSVHSVEGSRANSDEAFEATYDAISNGAEAIWQGLLRDGTSGLFGIPDLIVRGDVIERLVPRTMEGLDQDTYYVIDIKYKGLDLNKNGDLASAHKWDKVQIAFYERALAATLHRPVSRGFLLGRTLAGSAGHGMGCFSVLGWVKADDPKITELIKGGLMWRSDLETKGAAWTVLPLSDERLRPNDRNDKDSPWHNAKQNILQSLSPELGDGPNVSPDRFEVNRDDWHAPGELEFFVDFETLNALNDDFSKLPLMGGRAMIFMIGCGHVEEGQFNFHVWTADDDSHAEESRIIQEWLAHMDGVKERLAPSLESPRIYHWFRHEPQELGNAANRHGKPDWQNLLWYDLMEHVVKAQPALVKGANGFSIKPIARALKGFGAIETVWGESPVGDGVAAMAAAWHCYESARTNKVRSREVTTANGTRLIDEIEAYNLVDCKVMWEILSYVRTHH